jgi:hypothetical protein
MLVPAAPVAIGAVGETRKSHARASLRNMLVDVGYLGGFAGRHRRQMEVDKFLPTGGYVGPRLMSSTSRAESEGSGYARRGPSRSPRSQPATSCAAALAGETGSLIVAKRPVDPAAWIETRHCPPPGELLLGRPLHECAGLADKSCGVIASKEAANTLAAAFSGSARGRAGSNTTRRLVLRSKRVCSSLLLRTKCSSPDPTSSGLLRGAFSLSFGRSRARTRRGRPWRPNCRGASALPQSASRARRRR